MKSVRELSGLLHEDAGTFAEFLQEVRAAAGLTVREVATRMGVSEGGVSQYLYRRRGKGGTSSLRWFLRYLAACDCAVSVTMPGAERDDERGRTAFAAGGSAGVRGDGALGRPDRGHRPGFLGGGGRRGAPPGLRNPVAPANGSGRGDAAAHGRAALARADGRGTAGPRVDEALQRAGLRPVDHELRRRDRRGQDQS